MRGKLLRGPGTVAFFMPGLALPCASPISLPVRPGAALSASASEPAGLQCVVALDNLHPQRVPQIEADTLALVHAEVLAPPLVGALERHPQPALTVERGGTARLEIRTGGDGHRLLHLDRFAEAHHARVDVVVALIVRVPGDRDLPRGPAAMAGSQSLAGENETLCSG